MKTLILTRHAKTVPGDGQLADYDRYLTPRGHVDPVLVSKELINLGIIPEKIITSPAKRAYQTTEIIAEQFQITGNSIDSADFLYGYFHLDKLLNFIQDKARDNKVVQIIGHNPNMEELGAYLTGSLYRRIPTSGTMVLEFGVDEWIHISEGSASLIFFITPKQFKN